MLDLGSGAGLDAIIAWWSVGPTGTVIGVDLNPSMCLKAQAEAAATGVRMECHQGRMENIPLPDTCADVVISNGVINLSFRKRRVIEEMFRVRGQGGHDDGAEARWELRPGSRGLGAIQAESRVKSAMFPSAPRGGRSAPR